MRMPLPNLARLLLLSAAAFLMAADGDACIVVQSDDGDRDDDGDDDDDDGDDDGDECRDLERLCPSLVCGAGFVVDDEGCAICECQPSTCTTDIAGPPPECASPTLDPATCQWTCLSSECQVDADCPSSAICVDGSCRGLGLGCFGDADCAPGSFCDFGAAAAPPPPDGDGGGAQEPRPPGQCVSRPSCFSDADCSAGERCVPLDQAGGLVAIPSVCVADPNQQCDSDDDCALGERCAFGCTGSCPNCDDCTVVTSSCEVAAVPCTSDAECRRGETCLFENAGRRPCPDVDGDGQCDGFVDPPPPQGVCGVADVQPSCTIDDECGPGQVCRVVDDCNCAAVCIDDGQGGCLPCECPTASGSCAPVGPGDEECFDDLRCDAGEKCVIYAVGCENPCTTDADGTTVCNPCDPIPVGRCELAPDFCGSDVDCGVGEFCDFQIECPAVIVDCANGEIAVDLDGDGCALECVDPARCEAAGGCGAPIPPPGLCTPQDIDPCAGIICRGTDVCALDAAGLAACVENPCLANVCSDGSRCEVLRDGSFQCVP